MRVTMILAVGAIGLAFTVKTSAQVQTSTEEKAGQATKQVKVVNAEVISVQGNDLIVKMDDGTIRHIANVPESARATVDGKEVGVHDLKPGMHLQKTITTTSTPKVITTTKSVTGKVWYVSAPNSVILTMENGENQQFKIPKGQKFMVNGQQTDAFGLKKGMVVSATKVVEEPITQVQQEAQIAGHMPPPPPAPPADTPILVAVVTPTPAAPAAEAAPAALPKTASNLPLIALIGWLLLACALGIRVFRKAWAEF
jgi:hypothetical protein